MPADVALVPGLVMVCHGREYKFASAVDKKSKAGHDYTVYHFSGECAECGEPYRLKITGSQAAPQQKCFECQRVQWDANKQLRDRENSTRFALPHYATMSTVHDILLGVPGLHCSLAQNADRERLYAPSVLRARSALLHGYTQAEILVSIKACIANGWLGFGLTDKVPRYKARTQRKGLWITDRFKAQRYHIWLRLAEEALALDAYPSNVSKELIQAHAAPRAERARQALALMAKKAPDTVAGADGVFD